MAGDRHFRRWGPGSALVPEQRRQFGSHFVDHFICAVPEFLSAPRFPVNALHMVGEDDAGCAETGGNGHLERVAFRLIRNPACQGQTGFRIVDSRTEDQRRAPACLLTASLRVERQPDKIADIRHKGRITRIARLVAVPNLFADDGSWA